MLNSDLGIESIEIFIQIDVEFHNLTLVSYRLIPRKPESPKPKPRPVVEAGDGTTPLKKKHCNCKHSRCLKL